MNIVLDATKVDTRPAPELSVVIPTFNERENIHLIIARLRRVLTGIDWELVVVDDNSPDGTADVVRRIGEDDRRVRCIKRIHRRGLAGACIEGMLSSQARYLAVIDADLQHDEALLVDLLARIRQNDVNLVVGTRKQEAANGMSNGRFWLSRSTNAITRRFFGLNIKDPMSGFFMIRRDTFEQLAPSLSPQGFKLLLDIILSGRGRLKIAEQFYYFRDRNHGESKLDAKVALDFVGLLISKLSNGLISYRFFLFCLIGLSGLGIHMAILSLALGLSSLAFIHCQMIAVLGATTWNFVFNNSLTYRDRRLHNLRFVWGLVAFQAICSVGFLSNVGIASAIYSTDANWWLAGSLGAMMSVVWNYVVSAAFVWSE